MPNMLPASQIVASVPMTSTNGAELNSIFDKVGTPDMFFNESGHEFLIWEEMDSVSYGILEDLLNPEGRLIA